MNAPPKTPPRALVTGARGGIGTAVVERLLARGYQVIAQDLPSDAGSFADEPPFADEPRVQYVTGDLTTPTGRTHLREALGSEPLELVVPAHGWAGSGALRDLSREVITKTMRVNTGTIPPLLELTLPALRRAGGAFVVIVSQAGLAAEPNNSAYCASKFALVGWIRALAAPLHAQGVRLHGVCPARTKTALMLEGLRLQAEAAGLSVAEFERRSVERVPLQRFAEPTEVAAAILFLAEHAGNGPVLLAVTGGETLY